GRDLSESVDGRADRHEDAAPDSGSRVALSLAGNAEHAVSLESVFDLQEGVHVLADRDRPARTVQRLAVHADQIDEPFSLELVALLARRGGKGQDREAGLGREPEARRILFG